MLMFGVKNLGPVKLTAASQTRFWPARKKVKHDPCYGSPVAVSRISPKEHYCRAGILTCDGCARDPYFYVPAETQSYVIKLSCSRKVLATSGDCTRHLWVTTVRVSHVSHCASKTHNCTSNSTLCTAYNLSNSYPKSGRRKF